MVKVTWRAVFEFPQGILNPLGVKVPGRQEVELYSTGIRTDTRWEARAIIPGARPVRYTKFHQWATLALAKHDIEQSFREKLEDWRMWATPPVLQDGDAPQAHRPVEAGEVRECVGGWRWVMPEDFTHIMHGAFIKPDEKLPRAACGGKLDAKYFVNNMGNVAPSCPKCNEVYQAEYVAKRRIKETVK